MITWPKAVLVSLLGLIVTSILRPETLLALEAVVVVFEVMTGGIADVCTGVGPITRSSTAVPG